MKINENQYKSNDKSIQKQWQINKKWWKSNLYKLMKKQRKPWYTIENNTTTHCFYTVRHLNNQNKHWIYYVSHLNAQNKHRFCSVCHRNRQTHIGFISSAMGICKNKHWFYNVCYRNKQDKSRGFITFAIGISKNNVGFIAFAIGIWKKRHWFYNVCHPDTISG